MTDATLGLSATLKPRLIRPRVPRVRQIHLPGRLGRLAYTPDRGAADPFGAGALLLSTKLSAIVRDPAGRPIAEHDLGSGLVTNPGVLCLANDFAWASPSAAAVNTFASLKFHAWGTGITAAATTDIKLQTPAAPTATNAQTANSTALTANGEGKPKFVSIAKVVAGGALAITEWGIFTGESLADATGEPATASSATSITATATPYTASSTTVRGKELFVVHATEAEEVWGLVTGNTTSVLSVPAWYKVSNGAAGATPSASSKYKIRPVMFDHRVFAAINVETGNTIEFVWELEIKSGG